MRIREAEESDLSEIIRIYNQAVVDTVATFDLVPWVADEQLAWFSNFGSDHPFYVAEGASGLLGYGYYAPFRSRAAYAGTKELSVYVDPRAFRLGVGSALYQRLIETARRRNVHVLLGIVGGENPSSRALHEKFGFVQVGAMRQVGRKFGQWVDVFIYQKILDSDPAD